MLQFVQLKKFPRGQSQGQRRGQADSWAPDQVSELRLLTLCSDSSSRRGVMYLTEGSQETAEPPDAQQASAGTFPFRSKTDSSRDFSSAHRSLTSTDDCPPSPSHVLRSYVALFSPWAFSAHPPPLPWCCLHKLKSISNQDWQPLGWSPAQSCDRGRYQCAQASALFVVGIQKLFAELNHGWHSTSFWLRKKSWGWSQIWKSKSVGRRCVGICLFQWAMDLSQQRKTYQKAKTFILEALYLQGPLPGPTSSFVSISLHYVSYRSHPK